MAVTLDKASDEAVTVTYATMDGTAEEGLDYTAATGTLTFAAGARRRRSRFRRRRTISRRRTRGSRWS